MFAHTYIACIEVFALRTVIADYLEDEFDYFSKENFYQTLFGVIFFLGKWWRDYWRLFN